MTIIHNKIQCKNCGDVIESKHRHDWVACSCFKNEEDNQGVFVDGGTDYLRRGGKLENIIDLTEVEFIVVSKETGKSLKAKRYGDIINVFEEDGSVLVFAVGEDYERSEFGGDE